LSGVDLRVWSGVLWWCDAIASGGREGGVKVAVGLSGSVDRVIEKERVKVASDEVAMALFCPSADSVVKRMLI
jgi:hypothetical protein